MALNLVTGATGFIGGHVARQLRERKEEVRALVRRWDPVLAALGVMQVEGDLENLDAVEAACADVQRVFHIAARPGVWGAFADFYATNVTGTGNVIAGCIGHRVGQLVYTSSPSVVFGNQAHRGADESLDYPSHYENHYSETKAMAERMVRGANCDTLKTVTLRPHLVFGAGDRHLLPRVIERGRLRSLVQVGEGTNRVDLSYVRDVARAHLLAGDALDREPRAAGSVYFISQNEPVMLWPWIAQLLERCGIPPIRRRLSHRTARGLGAALEMTHRLFAAEREPRLTRFTASMLALDHYYDISAARRDLGFEPRFRMQDALDETLPWILGKEHTTGG